MRGCGCSPTPLEQRLGIIDLRDGAARLEVWALMPLLMACMVVLEEIRRAMVRRLFGNAAPSPPPAPHRHDIDPDQEDHPFAAVQCDACTRRNGGAAG